MLPHDRVIEHLLRWNIFVMLLLGTIHYFTDGWFFDLIELPIVFFFFYWQVIINSPNLGNITCGILSKIFKELGRL